MNSDIKRFKNLWYARNPVHENNADTGEDMFWATAELVAREYVLELLANKPMPPQFDTETCESCGNKFMPTNDTGVDDGGNHFCADCWKELKPVLKKEYDEMKANGEIEQ